MFFSRLSALFLLWLAVSACQKINNDVHDLKLRCGAGLKAGDSAQTTQILDPDGNVLAGADLQVFAEALDRDGKLLALGPLTEKACLEFAGLPQQTAVVIRSANPSKNWAKRLTYAVNPPPETRLELIDKQGLLAKCATDIVTQGDFVLPLTDLGAGRGLASLEVTLLSDAQEQRLGDATALVSDGRDSRFLIPPFIREGSHQIRVLLQDLLRPLPAQPKPFLCSLTVDRSKPIVSSSLDSAPDQLPIRVRPGQLISIRSQDLSPSTLYYCRQRTASFTCDSLQEFSAVDTEVSFNAEDGGDWDVYFFAEDRAKNRSSLRKISYTIFKFDMLEALLTASREAILIGKDDPFQGSLAALDLTPIYDEASSLEKLHAAPALARALIHTLAHTHVYRKLRASAELLAIKAVHGGGQAVLSSSELQLIDAKGEQAPQTLVKFPDKAAVIEMSLNPSGSRMAVIQYSSNSQRSTELSVRLQTFKCRNSQCVPSGELLEQRSRSACTLNANAVWSDDGNFLAYSRCGQLSLFALKAAEGFAKPVFETASRALMLRIAPDNNILAYYGESTISIWSMAEQRFLNAQPDTGELAESWLECNPLDMQFVELESISHLLIANDKGFKIWPNQSGCRSNVSWPMGRVLVADARIQSTPQSLAFQFDGYLAAYNSAELIAAGQKANQDPDPDASSNLEALPRLFVNNVPRDTRQWSYSEALQQFSLLTSSALTVFRTDTLNALSQEAFADFAMAFSQTEAGRLLVDNSAAGAWIIGLAKPWALAFASEKAPLPKARASEAVAFRWGLDGKLRVGDQNGQLFQLDLQQSAPAVKQLRLNGEIRQIAPYQAGQELIISEAGELVLVEDAAPRVIATKRARRFYESLVVDPLSASFITQARKTIELWKGIEAEPLLLVDNIGFSNDPLYRKLQLIFHQGAYAVAALVGRFDAAASEPRQDLQFFDFEGKAIAIAGRSKFPASAFAVSPDRSMLVIIHEEGSPLQQSISWIDLKRDTILAVTSITAGEQAFTGKSANLWLEFAPDNSKLAVIGYSGRVAVYSANSADDFKLLAARKSPFVSRPLLAWVYDSMQLAFVENNNTLVLTDATLKPSNVLVFKDLIAMLSASPVGNAIAVSLANQTSILPLDLALLRSMACEFLKPELEARVAGASYQVVCPK